MNARSECHRVFVIVIALFLTMGLPPAVSAQSSAIKFNQLGYYAQSEKIAIVPTPIGLSDEKVFSLVNVDTQETVFSGEVAPAAYWSFSDENVHKLDFSDFDSLGTYRLSVGNQRSPSFRIANNVFDELHKAAIKSYYLSRSGTQITAQFAGEFARKAGHLDTSVKIHSSAATKSRPAGHVVSASRGWYDAGDYGKYVVNSSITTYTLLLAYQQFADLYKPLKLDIPESSNQLPDLLDEIKWNLDWLEAMQDHDGGVYHKLTALDFTSMSMPPENHDAERYMIGKSVTATLGFSAVMSMASRVFSEFDLILATRYQQRAKRAYKWALKHPDNLYQQPKDVKTGAYADQSASDEFTWAAAELYLLTANNKYWQQFNDHKKSLKSGVGDSLSWSNVGALAYLSLLNARASENNLPELSLGVDELAQEYLTEVDRLWVRHDESAYNVAASRSDFKWGSNSAILNNGLLLYQAYRLTGLKEYQHAAFSTLNYVLGTNPTGYSYVTGFGHFSPQRIHNRLSESDNVKRPLPGLIVGGPHTGRQDKCDYSSALPATNYADIVCSYSTNETAINWNAPLVYLLGAMVSSKL